METIWSIEEEIRYKSPPEYYGLRCYYDDLGKNSVNLHVVFYHSYYDNRIKDFNTREINVSYVVKRYMRNKNGDTIDVWSTFEGVIKSEICTRGTLSILENRYKGGGGGYVRSYLFYTINNAYKSLLNRYVII